jgi:hypothetical protein
MSDSQRILAQSHHDLESAVAEECHQSRAKALASDRTLVGRGGVSPFREQCVRVRGADAPCAETWLR